MRLRNLSLALFVGTLLTIPLTAMGRGEGSIRKTWDYAEGIHTLIVDAERQDIVIKKGGPRVTGRLVGDGADSFKGTLEGDKLTITVKSDRAWFSWRRPSSRIELNLPEGMNLDLTTASGAVLVEVATTALHIRTASGDIEASEGGAAVDVDSSSGTVRLRGFDGPVKASALSGDLILEEISGLVQASTLSGNLRGQRLAPENQSRFTAVSGNVDLSLISGASAYLVHAESVSGTISVGGKRADDELTTGSGPSIVVKVVSGNVRIE